MSKLNGSVERLAEALRDVVREGAEEAVAPLREEMQAGFARIDSELTEIRGEVRETEERLNTRIDRAVKESEQRLHTRIDRAVEDIVAERQTERSS